MTSEILGYNYELSWRIIGKDDMKYFETPNQRQIRNNQVKKILNALKEGCHFDVPIVVRQNNGTRTLTIIDGGHRVIAMGKYFEIYPDAKIKIMIAVYKEIPDEKIGDVFTIWNSGIKQSLDDYIDHFKHHIPIFKDVMDELPIAVYGTKDKMRFRYLIMAYFDSKKPDYTGYTVVSSVSARFFIERIKQLTYEDVESMKDTFEIIKEIFNPDDITDFTRLEPFKFQFFSPLFHLVANNKVMLGKNYVRKRIRTVLYKSADFKLLIGNGSQASYEVYEKFKRKLNHNAERQFV